jgi:hypothetical protein
MRPSEEKITGRAEAEEDEQGNEAQDDPGGQTEYFAHHRRDTRNQRELYGIRCALERGPFSIR